MLNSDTHSGNTNYVIKHLYTTFLCLFLFFIWHIHSKNSIKFSYSLDIMHEPWPTYCMLSPLLYFYITFQKLQTEWSTQVMKTLTPILLFWRMFPVPSKTSKLNKKILTDSLFWLSTIMKYYPIPSQHESAWWHWFSWFSVFCSLALGSGLHWSSNGFVKYLWSLNCVLKCKWGFQVKCKLKLKNQITTFLW